MASINQNRRYPGRLIGYDQGKPIYAAGCASSFTSGAKSLARLIGYDQGKPIYGAAKCCPSISSTTSTASSSPLDNCFIQYWQVGLITDAQLECYLEAWNNGSPSPQGNIPNLVVTFHNEFLCTGLDGASVTLEFFTTNNFGLLTPYCFWQGSFVNNCAFIYTPDCDPFNFVQLSNTTLFTVAIDITGHLVVYAAPADPGINDTCARAYAFGQNDTCPSLTFDANTTGTGDFRVQLPDFACSTFSATSGLLEWCRWYQDVFVSLRECCPNEDFGVKGVFFVTVEPEA